MPEIGVSTLWKFKIHGIHGLSHAVWDLKLWSEGNVDGLRTAEKVNEFHKEFLWTPAKFNKNKSENVDKRNKNQYNSSRLRTRNASTNL